MPNVAWSSLTATQIKEVIRAWPNVPEYAVLKPSGSVTPVVAVPAKKEKANAKSKLAKKGWKAAAKTAAKTAAKPAGKRQKHTGADGEIKFVDHRNLYVGFFGGRVVVTKRTREACAEYLRNVHGVQCQG